MSKVTNKVPVVHPGNPEPLVSPKIARPGNPTSPKSPKR
jgi:hypothetical protein